MTPFRLAGCLLAPLLILGGSLPLAARTFSLDEEKCHVDLPDGWSEQKVEGNKISVINADQTKSFMMRTVQTGTAVTLDNASFIKGFENSIVTNGATITDRQRLPLAGVDAYVVDTTQSVPAGTVYNRLAVTLANGYAYALITSKLNAKPSDDDELNAIVKSFAFVGEPELHKAVDPVDNLSYRLGEFVGGVIFPLLAIAVFFKWLRRKKGTA